jgi:hypothetical protein
MLFAVPASGQEGGDLHLRAVFDRLSSPAPGVSVAVANAPPGPPAITVTNTSKTVFEVLGFDFEPFLRISSAGVQGNRASRAFYVTQDATGSGSIPSTAHAGAVPKWVALSRTGTWHWFEPRARWQKAIPAATLSARKPVTLGSWIVGARYDSAPVSILGRIVWKPVLGAVRVRFARPPTAVRGLRITLLQGALPGIAVTNDSGKLFEITGRDGAPFARVGPSGVDVNVESATWRDTMRLSGSAPKGTAWRHTQDAPVLAWLERRAAYFAEEPPRAVIESRRTAILLRWHVPATLDGAPKPIDGVTEWVPADRAGRPPKLAVVVAAGAAAIGVAFGAFRRRHSRAARV